MHRAIQFIGTQRSGSNLLRLILNQHDLISAPHPPHMLKNFVPLLPQYQADGETDLNQLVDDMCRWVELNPVPWTHVNLNRQQILKKSASIFDIFEQIYLQKAIADNAEIWCCKSTFNVRYVEQLEKKIKPFYIHLYRDGRDVAASFKKVIVGPKHIYHLAMQWKEEQELAMNFLQQVGPERKIQVAYESLLQNPDEVISSICRKLGVEYSSNMLRYYKSEESQHTAESGKMWEHVIEPIIRNNLGKYHQELTEVEIAIFEKVAGDALDRLGYMREFARDKNNIVLDIDQFNALNSQWMAEARAKGSAVELQKRTTQERLLEEIRNRAAVKK